MIFIAIVGSAFLYGFFKTLLAPQQKKAFVQKPNNWRN